MKKIFFAVVFLVALPACADGYITVGKSYRAQSAQVSAGYEFPVQGNVVGADVSFTDCGKQPAPHKNINRFLSLSLMSRMVLSDNLSLIGQAGINSSRFSHNGENSFVNDADKIGYNAGIGLLYRITDNVSLYSLATVYQYMQANNPLYGGYTTIFAGLRFQ